MKRGNGGPVPSTANDDDAATALHRLRVVALGEGVAPVFAGRWLAAFGADVTAVEPVVGHWLRRYSPTGGTWQGPMGPLGTFLYAGASVIALDADREQDRAALSDLLAGADILLHDLTEDGLARWGLEERAPWADLPALIQVALTPFGTDGPYAGYAATSIVSLALGGYQFLTGEPGREPLMLPGFQPEYLTALYGVIAALAGVSRRHEEGSGCAVEISAMEALASLHQFTTSQWLYEGSIRTRHGNRWENLYPITMLPCRDGYVTLSMPGPEMWERLCLMIERPDLVQDPRFAIPALRHANAEALDAILCDWLQERDMDDLFRTAQEQWRLPVNPYHELRDVLRDPQYNARGFWVRSDGDGGVVQP
ncbi:MAG: CaiB/BaiF CoA transferase family protein, partial [Dehalococcoidia bacterium]